MGADIRLTIYSIFLGNLGSQESDTPVDMQQQKDKLSEPLSCLKVSPPGCRENGQKSYIAEEI